MEKYAEENRSDKNGALNRRTKKWFCMFLGGLVKNQSNGEVNVQEVLYPGGKFFKTLRRGLEDFILADFCLPILYETVLKILWRMVISVYLYRWQYNCHSSAFFEKAGN